MPHDILSAGALITSAVLTLEGGPRQVLRPQWTLHEDQKQTEVLQMPSMRAALQINALS